MNVINHVDDLRDSLEAAELAARTGAFCGVALGSLRLVVTRFERALETLDEVEKLCPSVSPPSTVRTGLSVALEDKLKPALAMLELVALDWADMGEAPQSVGEYANTTTS